MTDPARQQEDVAGLFRKFGGDAASYKEFAPVESPRAAGGWPLVHGTRGTAEAAAPVAAVSAVPAAAPLPVPAAPAAVATALLSPSSAPATDPAPRELDALFARLLGAAAPAAAAGQGLMSHWRRSG